MVIINLCCEFIENKLHNEFDNQDCSKTVLRNTLAVSTFLLEILVRKFVTILLWQGNVEVNVLEKRKNKSSKFAKSIVAYKMSSISKYVIYSSIQN